MLLSTLGQCEFIDLCNLTQPADVYRGKGPLNLTLTLKPAECTAWDVIFM